MIHKNADGSYKDKFGKQFREQDRPQYRDFRSDPRYFGDYQVQLRKDIGKELHDVLYTVLTKRVTTGC